MKKVKMPHFPDTKQLKRYYERTSPEMMWRYSFDRKKDGMEKCWGIGSFAVVLPILGYILIFLPVILAVNGVVLPIPVDIAVMINFSLHTLLLFIAFILGNKYAEKHIGAEAAVLFVIESAVITVASMTIVFIVIFGKLNIVS